MLPVWVQSYVSLVEFDLFILLRKTWRLLNDQSFIELNSM